MEGMDHSTMGSGGSSMGSMTLHFGEKETVLFSFWDFSTTWGLILSCVILVMISIAKELARVGRSVYAKGRENNRNAISRVVDALLHAVVLTLSYFLMVIFMNLNVWMCITIVAAEVICAATSSYCASLMNVGPFEK